MSSTEQSLEISPRIVDAFTRGETRGMTEASLLYLEGRWFVGRTREKLQEEINRMRAEALQMIESEHEDCSSEDLRAADGLGMQWAGARALNENLRRYWDPALAAQIDAYHTKLRLNDLQVLERERRRLQVEENEQSA